MISEAIRAAAAGKDLDLETCSQAAIEIMEGNATDIQIASLLSALKTKGETSEEITSFARAMKQFCIQISPRIGGALVDTCGTGGDSLNTFNISTAAALIVASAGIPVAKHGNCSISSNCGSADILEAVGVNIRLTPEQTEKTIEKIGIGFMFAPLFHPAMKNVQKVRQELGIRTIFNLLGPLTNPANAKAQVIGVYSRELVMKVAKALNSLGTKSALVVHGSGMDEISTLGTTKMAQLKDGEITLHQIRPEDFGIRKPKLEELQAKDIDTSVSFLREALSGKQGPRLDIVLLNAAAAIMVAGKAKTIMEGLELARESVQSGKASEKLNKLVEVSQGYGD